MGYKTPHSPLQMMLQENVRVANTSVALLTIIEFWEKQQVIHMTVVEF